jgi:hypothetical protein
MMPGPRGADEIDVVAQRGQGQFRFFKRDESAALANHFADTLEK